MAILMRGGAYADFDPSKLKPREWAVVLENDPSARDGKAIYICFAAGVVKRISTYEDMYDDLLTATDDIREQYIQAFNEIKAEIEKLKADTEGFKNIAETKANESLLSAQSADESADIATQKASAASTSAINAADSADDSEGFSNLAKSYSIGTNGEIRVGDETDNSKYYKEECQRLMQEIERLLASISSGGLIAAGTIPFEKLPTDPQVNYMYNISNDFVTDERFAEGAGISYSRGTNVYYAVDGKWDVLTGVSVLGVKGENESVYQTGYVNITKESLGLDEVDSNIQEQIDEITDKITKMQKIVYVVKNADSLRPSTYYKVGWLSDILYGGDVSAILDADMDYYQMMTERSGSSIGYVSQSVIPSNHETNELIGFGIYRVDYLMSFSDLYVFNSKVSLTASDESEDNLIMARCNLSVSSSYRPATNDTNFVCMPKIKFLRQKPSYNPRPVYNNNETLGVYVGESNFYDMSLGVDFLAKTKTLSKIAEGQLKVDCYVSVMIRSLDYITLGYGQSIS